ncbi:sulfotransferase [Mangrovimonas sp. YM274]|uniref:sulfotransferase n=1 Tax=Mangrovimonas sp. YM274 TaxID=3070660 RepID=UPI0027DCFC87|nr:sulfotransferase [Mangrovimonas sp. YM274]WMI69837.1 sulfotransferase [Mangrovimonas sp. YM274]
MRAKKVMMRLQEHIKKLVVKILISCFGNRIISFEENDSGKVVFIMGMFRSGTTLTAQVMRGLGFKMGPDWQLLKGVGKRKQLNPNGFYEDYLFSALAWYWMHKLNKTGDDLPKIEEVNGFCLENLPVRDFILFCEQAYLEERISYFNKIRAYVYLIINKEKAFYRDKEVIKVPMLVPFHKQLIDWFPNAKFLIVIRNPDATISSSKVLTEKSGIELYNSYYDHLVSGYEECKEKCTVLSYDILLQKPEESIKILSKLFGKEYKETKSLIDKKLIRNKDKNEWISDQYLFLFKEAVNGLQVI